MSTNDTQAKFLQQLDAAVNQHTECGQYHLLRDGTYNNSFVLRLQHRSGLLDLCAFWLKFTEDDVTVVLLTKGPGRSERYDQFSVPPGMSSRTHSIGCYGMATMENTKAWMLRHIRPAIDRCEQENGE